MLTPCCPLFVPINTSCVAGFSDCRGRVVPVSADISDEKRFLGGLPVDLRVSTVVRIGYRGDEGKGEGGKGEGEGQSELCD